MNWISFALLAAVVIGLWFWKRSGQVSLPEARNLLQQGGGMILDVRSRSEFQSGHLPGAVNLPLDEIGRALPEVKEKSQPLLLHCASGVRSAVAQRKLKIPMFLTSDRISARNKF